MRPSRSPDAAKQSIPAPALVQTLPSVSTRMPSGKPCFRMKRGFPPLSVPSSPTSKARMWRGFSGSWAQAESAT
jgi:hypothetical protein